MIAYHYHGPSNPISIYTLLPVPVQGGYTSTGLDTPAQNLCTKSGGAKSGGAIPHHHF